MKKDPSIFLLHILESVSEIQKYTIGLSKKDFDSDLKTQDAVARRIEIIGEAVKNLPNDFKQNHPEVPWKDMAGMRDVLIHDYFGVDLMAVWNVIQRDLPELEKLIGKIVVQK